MRNRLARGALFGFFICLTGCTVWPKHAVATWNNATGGETLERSFWHDVKGRDWNELQRHLAANYVWVSPSGRLDRAAALEYLQTVRLEDYSLGNLQTELNGNTFVVNYTLTVRGTAQKQPLPAGPVQVMTVWQRQKSGWVAIAHSETEPAPR
jgi:Domain of unknown function (DUF4440)